MIYWFLAFYVALWHFGGTWSFLPHHKIFEPPTLFDFIRTYLILPSPRILIYLIPFFTDIYIGNFSSRSLGFSLIGQFSQGRTYLIKFCFQSQINSFFLSSLLPKRFIIQQSLKHLARHQIILAHPALAVPCLDVDEIYILLSIIITRACGEVGIASA